MNGSEIQTQRVLELPTSQLLDLIAGLFPEISRRKLNDHLYRKYRFSLLIIGSFSRTTLL